MISFFGHFYLYHLLSTNVKNSLTWHFQRRTALPSRSSDIFCLLSATTLQCWQAASDSTCVSTHPTARNLMGSSRRSMAPIRHHHSCWSDSLLPDRLWLCSNWNSLFNASLCSAWAASWLFSLWARWLKFCHVWRLPGVQSCRLAVSFTKEFNTRSF